MNTERGANWVLRVNDPLGTAREGYFVHDPTTPNPYFIDPRSPTVDRAFIYRRTVICRTVNVIPEIIPVEPIPIDPVDPFEPVEPVDPIEPVNPVDPVDPVKPVDPKDPVKPVKPDEPINPIDPVIPVDPITNPEEKLKPTFLF